MTLNELYDRAGRNPGGRWTDGGGCVVSVSSLGAGRGWTAQTGGALQRGVDSDLDRARQIGGDDDATRHRGVGTLTRGMAEEGAARDAEELSVCGDLQQRVTGARCRAGERGGHTV